MENQEQSPHLIIISGPNGAGKSTIAPKVLRGVLGVDEFVNADVIAKGLSAFNPEGVSISAGRIMLKRLHELAAARKNFAFETTLASRSFYPWISELLKTGYAFHLIHLWLPSPEMSIARVKARVARGGHHVPDDVVRRRYDAGLRNFFHLYMNIASSWYLYDNYDPDNPDLIASGHESSVESVYNYTKWHLIAGEYDDEEKYT